jgi:hypothetical protein
MTLEEIIAKLPEEFQPWARQYGNAFLDMAFTELTNLVDKIAEGNFADAYAVIVSRFTTEELIRSQQRVNEELIKLNKQNASFAEFQKQLVKDALNILLLIFHAVLKGEQTN